MKLKYFSTFTGVGGLDWGLELLGAKCVGFSEIRESSIAIYQRHYPDHKLYGDITKIVPKDLPDFDVFTGGFPCQSFSIAGARKGFGDRRGQMIFFIYDILVAKKPEFFVLENVKGIMNHNEGETFRSVFKLLSAAGYHVRCVLLNSSHYGSAQARERVVFIGRRSKDFPDAPPWKTDDQKRFRDFRDKDAKHYKWASETVVARMERTWHSKGKFSLLGGYDRVNTLTTGLSTSGRSQVLVQEKGERFRYLTELEGERLQGFPDGWTEGAKRADRWFAIGNAVNMRMSEFLFTNYLKEIWKI